MPSYLDDEDESILPDDDEARGLTPDEGGSGFAAPIINRAPDRPPTPPLDASAYGKAADKVAQITAQKPSAPQPKWWQRALAGGVGALTGISNSQHKGPPIDPTGAEEAILAPGYRRSLGEWNRKLEGATAEQAAEKNKLSTLEQIQRINAEKEYREANKPIEISEEVARKYGIMRSADGRFYAPARAVGQLIRTENPQERTQWKTDPKTGRMYNTVTGETKEPARTASQIQQERRQAVLDAGQDPKESTWAHYIITGDTKFAPAEKPDRKLDPTDVKLHRGDGTYTKAQEAEADRMFQQMHRQPADPNAQKPAPRSQFRLIEDEKQRDLEKAEQQAHKRIHGDANNEPEDPQAVAADLERQKQRIQNAYEAKIEAAGASSQHFEYGSPSAKSQSASPPAQSQPRVMPRAKIAEVAKRANITPQQAEAQLKKEGWSIQ